MTAPADRSRTALVESCQGLVRSLAVQVGRKFHGRFELDDLIAYGQVGLAQAAKDFQADRGTQFSTYAYYRIRGAIYDGIARMNWGGRPTQEARFQQHAGDVLEQNAEEPTAGAGQDDARWFTGITSRLAVVYLASGAGGESAIEARAAETAAPSAAMQNRELYEKLHAVIDKLPEEQRSLIRMTYFDGLTLHEAAQKLGFSKSWASRLHAKCLATLAADLRQVGLAD
ncbi:MAG: sigma-70 family RNA polymerase sigma factor [Planctomycetia bacterium]|nr:sigma-70 family RNA polymerase sigma factor [Planctomycetia bacterium]